MRRSWTVPIVLAPLFVVQICAAVSWPRPMTILNAASLGLVLGFAIGLRLGAARLCAEPKREGR